MIGGWRGHCSSAPKALMVKGLEALLLEPVTACAEYGIGSRNVPVRITVTQLAGLSPSRDTAPARKRIAPSCSGASSSKCRGFHRDGDAKASAQSAAVQATARTVRFLISTSRGQMPARVGFKPG